MAPEDATAALAQALSTLHIASSPAAADYADLVVEVDGPHVPLRVKPYSLIDMPRAMQIVRDVHEHPGSSADVVTVVVAARVVAGARDLLREARQSWFDLRGHLFLLVPGLRIDAATPSLLKAHGKPVALTSRSGISTAVDILLHRPSRVAVRETARRVKAAPSTVSEAVKALREEGLVDELGRPDLSSLFWATAGRWRPQWTAVERYPDPREIVRNPALRVGIEDPERPGWALSGDLAAAILGAPVAVSPDAAPDLYVPTTTAHRLAVSVLGENRTLTRPGARLALAPVPAACVHRLAAAAWHDDHWLLARTLFVALDLAQDPGRGREILDDWRPPEAHDRVW